MAFDNNTPKKFPDKSPNPPTFLERPSTTDTKLILEAINGGANEVENIEQISFTTDQEVFAFNPSIFTLINPEGNNGVVTATISTGGGDKAINIQVAFDNNTPKLPPKICEGVKSASALSELLRTRKTAPFVPSKL